MARKFKYFKNWYTNRKNYETVLGWFSSTVKPTSSFCIYYVTFYFVWDLKLWCVERALHCNPVISQFVSFGWKKNLLYLLHHWWFEKHLVIVCLLNSSSKLGLWIKNILEILFLPKNERKKSLQLFRWLLPRNFEKIRTNQI